jgi:hypothetical protein
MGLTGAIQTEVRAHLAGRPVDVVGMVRLLLDAARDAGEICCRLSPDGAGLRFEFPQSTLVEDVSLDRARAKLRMMCARLAVLCREHGAPDVSPYGGEGEVESGGGVWHVRFVNTPSQHEFTIRPSDKEP